MREKLGTIHSQGPKQVITKTFHVLEGAHLWHMIVVIKKNKVFCSQLTREKGVNTARNQRLNEALHVTGNKV